jgi:hypothetical protein
MKTITKNLILMGITILVFFIIFEAVLHSFNLYDYSGPSRSVLSIYDPVTGWKLKPDFNITEKNSEFEAYYQINSDGFRNNLKFNGDEKILFIGDSFTFGHGVGEEERYSSIIGKYGNYNIRNLGTPGYGTDQELLILKEEIDLFGPDIVIVGYLVENIARNIERYPRLGNINTGLDYERPLFIVENNKLVLSNTPTIKPEELDDIIEIKTDAKEKIKEYCFSCVFFYRGFRSFSPKESVYDSYQNYYLEGSYDWKLTKLIFEEIKREVKNRGGRLIIVVIPLQEDVKSYDNTEFEYQKRFLELENFEIIDLTKAFSEEEEEMYYQYDSHWNKEGHLFGANLILDYLKS